MARLLNRDQLEQLAIDAGFSRTPYAVLDGLPPYRVAAAIGFCEGQTEASRVATGRSGIDYADADAVGDQALANSVWGFSYDVLQVRSLRSQKGTGKYRDELRLPDPAFCFASGLEIWQQFRARPNPPLINGRRNWTGFEGWSTFVGLQYQAYLPDAYPVPASQYVVRSGDALSIIAARVGVGVWQDWQQVNQLPDPDLLHIAQKLDRPWWTHLAAPGETWASLAALNHLKTARLRGFNRAPTGQPTPGQPVQIPHVLLTRPTP